MKALTQLFVMGLLALMMAGCGSNKVTVRPETTSHVRTIALIKVDEPKAYVAQDFGNPGMMFGAVGGAVAGSSSANAGKSVNQIASEANFSAGQRLTTLLQQRLTAVGYKVKLVEVTREKGHELLEKYDSVDVTGTDAILDIAIVSVGYATEHPMMSPHWRPASQIKVAMLDSRKHNTIFADKYMYGYHNPFMSGTDLDAPKAYHFDDKEMLFKDSKKLLDGMEQSLIAVADQIASTLKK
jgi:hypothetical protein